MTHELAKCVDDAGLLLNKRKDGGLYGFHGIAFTDAIMKWAWVLFERCLFKEASY
ncbi:MULTISPECIES: hypothetical protein [unclassified Bartonella]|uniref:hypothetical protein n=1 Tax=unclassified Bartonella TaxID=2645622 RepID=UPI0035CFD846